MMHPVWWYVFLFFSLGIGGTLLANRGQDPATQQKRWLKVWVHLALTVLLVMILQAGGGYAAGLALVLIAGGGAELAWVARFRLQSGWYYLAVAILYGLIGWGFWRHASESATNTLLYVFLIVFTFDGFSQIFGQMLGRHKLFPETSPNKTTEGLAGGAAMALLTAILTCPWIDCSPSASLANGIALSVAALAGDYLASVHKRRHGVKDYNNLIPGHGGLLDRFDSWLLAGAWAGWFGWWMSCS